MPQKQPNTAPVVVQHLVPVLFMRGSDDPRDAEHAQQIEVLYEEGTHGLGKDQLGLDAEIMFRLEVQGCHVGSQLFHCQGF